MPAPPVGRHEHGTLLEAHRVESRLRKARSPPLSASRGAGILFVVGRVAHGSARGRAAPPLRGATPAPGAAYSSRGAPRISLGSRKLFPVKRRIVAWSIRRSTVAAACTSEGKKLFHLVKPQFAVRTIEPLPWRSETTRKT